MRLEIAESIDAFDSGDWNRLAGDRYPFLRHEFLHAAEASGSVSADSGWSPRHLGLRDAAGRLVGVMPLYEKTHSWGEFVFDWSWANAYERAGIPYYPKLVSAVPFTPATSARLLAPDPDHRAALIRAAVELARSVGYSSLHVLFPEPAELELLRSAGLSLRKDCQFHWRNGGYRDFDEFLATFSSSKRKKARRDRRKVAEQGISFARFKGGEIDDDLWSLIYELISITFLRRGSMPYFNLDFFREVARTLPDSLLAIVALRDSAPIAAALFYDSATTLYGRYWGADARYDALHFETCYYQGIDYCIDMGRQEFEPGTQGEHKISRGFLPVETWSAHWLERPEFFAAIDEYVKSEARHVDRYMEAVNEHSPYRRGDPE